MPAFFKLSCLIVTDEWMLAYPRLSVGREFVVIGSDYVTGRIFFFAIGGISVAFGKVVLLRANLSTLSGASVEGC